MSIAAGFRGRIDKQTRAQALVFSFLEVRDFAAVASVCCEWDDMLNGPSFWSTVMSNSAEEAKLFDDWCVLV